MPQTPNGTVIGMTDGNRPIIVEEGPPWLASLIYTPPEWLPVALSIVGLLVCLGVVAVWRRRGSPDPETVHEAVANGITAILAIATVSGLQSFVEWPYVVDVVVAGVVAWAFAVVTVRAAVESRASNP